MWWRNMGLVKLEELGIAQWVGGADVILYQTLTPKYSTPLHHLTPPQISDHKQQQSEGTRPCPSIFHLPLQIHSLTFSLLLYDQDAFGVVTPKGSLPSGLGLAKVGVGEGAPRGISRQEGSVAWTWLSTKGHTAEPLHTRSPRTWGHTRPLPSTQAPRLVAWGSCTLPLWLPHRYPLFSNYLSGVCHQLLAGPLADALTKQNGHRQPRADWMNTSGTFSHFLTPLITAGSRKGRQRRAMNMWRWRLSILSISFLRILPDLYTLNGRKMLPGN